MHVDFVDTLAVQYNCTRPRQLSLWWCLLACMVIISASELQRRGQTQILAQTGHWYVLFVHMTARQSTFPQSESIISVSTWPNNMLPILWMTADFLLISTTQFRSWRSSLVWKFPRTPLLLCRKLINWHHLVVAGMLLPNESKVTQHSRLGLVTNEVKK